MRANVAETTDEEQTSEISGWQSRGLFQVTPRSLICHGLPEEQMYRQPRCKLDCKAIVVVGWCRAFTSVSVGIRTIRLLWRNQLWREEIHRWRLPRIMNGRLAKNQNRTNMHIFSFRNSFCFCFKRFYIIIIVFILFSFFESQSFSFLLTKCNHFHCHQLMVSCNNTLNNANGKNSWCVCV